MRRELPPMPEPPPLTTEATQSKGPPKGRRGTLPPMPAMPAEAPVEQHDTFEGSAPQPVGGEPHPPDPQNVARRRTLVPGNARALPLRQEPKPPAPTKAPRRPEGLFSTQPATPEAGQKRREALVTITRIMSRSQDRKTAESAAMAVANTLPAGPDRKDLIASIPSLLERLKH